MYISKDSSNKATFCNNFNRNLAKFQKKKKKNASLPSVFFNKQCPFHIDRNQSTALLSESND